MQLTDAVATYSTQLRADGRSRHTVLQMQRHARLLVGFLGDVQVETLAPDDLARFLGSDAVTKRADGGPRRPSSANCVRSSIRGLGNYLHVSGITTSNVARLIRRARATPPRPKGLTDLEVQRLTTAMEAGTTRAQVRDRVLFTLLLRTGLRIGSALALDIADVDLDAAELTVRTLKNGGTDTVLLPPDVIEPLRTFVGDRRSGRLFAIGARQANRRLELLAAKAGITSNVHPHTLRRTFATHAYERSRDVMVVARLLLHRGLSAATRYATPSQQMLRNAVGG